MVKYLWLLVFSFSLQSVILEDHELKEKFNASRKIVLKGGTQKTLKFYAQTPEESDDFEDFMFSLLKQRHIEEFSTSIPHRKLMICFNTPEREEKGYGEVGYISLSEIFVEKGEPESAFLILNKIWIREGLQRQGYGTEALSAFLETLDGIDSPGVSKKIYAFLGNSQPGVFKMYLNNGFNYFYEAKSKKILDVDTVHKPGFLEKMQQGENLYAATDIPTSCLIAREEKRARLYAPYVIQ